MKVACCMQLRLSWTPFSIHQQQQYIHSKLFGASYMNSFSRFNSIKATSSINSNKCMLTQHCSSGISLPIVRGHGFESQFKDSAESETTWPSRIRFGPLQDESESRVGRLNSEETDSAENRSWFGRLGRFTAESVVTRPSQPSRLRFSAKSARNVYSPVTNGYKEKKKIYLA